MNYLSKLLNLLRKLYNLPGVSHIVDKTILEYLKGRSLSTHNKVDDKLVLVIEAALENRNYRAVMNNRTKK